MNKTKKKRLVIQQTALFMTFLILTLPFFSAQAYGLSITKVTVVGGDGVEDVMTSDNDYFTATVQTSEEVDADDIQISYTKDESFDECSGTTCTYTSSQTDRSGQEMDYTIQLLNNSIVVDDVEGTILIDGEEPTIEEFSLDEDDEEETLTLSYEVEDTACDDCDGCSGIDYLVLYQDEVEIQTINAASECSLEDELETSITELNLEDGDHELCLIAFDNVGYESDDACVAISVDSEGPHFETNSFQVVDPTTGNSVAYIGADAVLVDVYVNVTDVSLSENTIVGDFSALNSIIGDSYADISANSCSEVDEDEEEGTTTYRCAWYSIYIEGVSGTLTVAFSAEDNEGNEGTYSPSFSVTQDDTAPTVVRVYNELGEEDIYLKSGTNSVYADFDPTGSSLSFEQAYLTFGLASISEDDATDCWENGSYWTCVWNFSMSYSGTASSSLFLDATDDAGNVMEQYEVDVGTDSQEPEILSISTNLDCPTGSDVLEVTINATDDSDELYATFYGEDVRTDDDPITEECNFVDEETMTCLLSVNDLVSYPEDEDVVIEVSDLAGNIAEEELDVSVCELEESGTPDLVTIYVDDDLTEVDKLTLSYIDYPLYVPLTFSMSSSAHIVSKTGSCENIESVSFIDTSETESLMVLTIPSQVVPNATYVLNFDCQISMTMQYGENVYSNAEVEEVEISVDLYGTPLGSIESAIDANIKLQKYWIAEKQKDIEGLVWLNRILGVMCNLAGIMNKLNMIISGFRVLLTIVGVGAYKLAKTPATLIATPFYEFVAGFNVLADRVNYIILTFIWPPGNMGGPAGITSPFTKLPAADILQQLPTDAPAANVKPNLLGIVGAIVKTGCIIYSGRYCEGYAGIENSILAEEAGSPGYYDAYYGGTQYAANPVEAEKKIQLFADWDPYKSIHTAKSCLYPDAIIYNMRKERQINCMYTTCLEENAKNGLLIDICDVQYKERECLYVDGAAWLALNRDWFFHFVELTLNTALANLDVFALTTTYYVTCKNYDAIVRNTPEFYAEFYAINPYVPGAGFGGMLQNTACHAMSVTLSLAETRFFTEGFSSTQLSDWDFEANLEGTDYCAGY